MEFIKSTAKYMARSATSRFQSGSHKATKRRRVRNRDRVHYGELENRLLLATFIVTTASDTNSGVADGFVSLREAVIAANTNSAFGDASAGDATGDVIRFDPSIYNSTMSLTLGQIGISDDVLIQGGDSNITITGNGNTRLFEVASTERVGFSKLTFDNGSAAIGGAMTAIGSGTTLLFQMNFTNNVSTGVGGGAIYYANGNMFVTDSTFNGNRANGVSGSGGAIYQASGNIYATDGLMDANTANRSGGALESVGGTFFSIGLTVGTTSAGNVAGPVGSANPGNGGGFHVAGSARVTVQGGEFVNNFAAQDGGGLWVGGSGKLFVRPGTDVTNNRAAGALIGQGGGGIYNDNAELYVNQANINSNSASGASGSGGGIYSEAGKTVLNLSTVDGNASRRTGGGIHVDAGFLQLTNSNVTANDVGTTFVSGVGHGGGIYAQGASSVVVNDGQVANNDALSRGGGIWADTGSLVFLRNTASIGFNTLSAAGGLGGGMYTTGYLRATDSFFQRNVATTSGGGLYLGGTINSRIDNTTFFQNDGGNRGGGIFNDSSMYITDSSLTSNTVTGNGGGYFTTGAATTLASGLSFFGNVPNNTN